ncbi:protein CCSMST1 [Manacus candei]|uniref:protein CCSMST1 n=1 Tax=Manacus candei TaxID=415023 RepID=UPI0022277809|nr:protein CCSMST1 [Manacus candei]
MDGESAVRARFGSSSCAVRDPVTAAGAFAPPLPSGAGRCGMIWALGRWRARRPPRLPEPWKGLARRRDPEGAAGADPESGVPIPFSSSKASPRVWSVSRSMGSDHERPWLKVLPFSVLCTGLLLWCVFREKTEIDERLEAVFSGEIVDSLDMAQESNAPLQLPKEQ